MGLDPVRQLSPGMTHGTTMYMPPELLLHGELSFAVDVYSFGVLCKGAVFTAFTVAALSCLRLHASSWLVHLPIRRARSAQTFSSYLVAAHSMVRHLLSSNPSMLHGAAT